MPAFPYPIEPLSGDRVTVRDYAARDIPEILIAYQDDPQLHVRMRSARPPSAAELGRRAEEEAALRASGAGATLTLIESACDTWRGAIHVHGVDWEHRRAQLEILLAPQGRGRGLARDALRLACAWLFGTCGLERAEILTDPDNDAMIRTAQAAGFVHEGVLRAYWRRGEDRADAAVLSILPGGS
jgi:RimJ/RimL family protein N-acetyltransferase